MITKTLSPEMDRWLQERTLTEAVLEQASEAWSEAKPEKRRTSPEWARVVEFTESEWRLLWSRFQIVGTPSIGFARRIQTCGIDIMRMSDEQRAWALALAYKYRRKIFFNPKAGQLDAGAFVHGIRQLAERTTQ